MYHIFLDCTASFPSLTGLFFFVVNTIHIYNKIQAINTFPVRSHVINKVILDIVPIIQIIITYLTIT